MLLKVWRILRSCLGGITLKQKMSNHTEAGAESNELASLRSIDSDEHFDTSVNSPLIETRDGEPVEGNLHLEHVGSVSVKLSEDSLVWQVLNKEKTLNRSTLPEAIPISQIYGVDLYDMGPIREFMDASSLLKPLSHVTVTPGKMCWFVVHSFEKSISNNSKWVPKSHFFAHLNIQVIQQWVSLMKERLENDKNRPKSLLVLINPHGGKGLAVQRWNAVSPLFDRAGVRVKMIKTEKAGHACDMIQNASEEDLNLVDGVVVVGGDGLFNEVLNGLAMKWHDAPLPPTPGEVAKAIKKATEHKNGGSTFSSSGEKGREAAHLSLEWEKLKSPQTDSQLLLGEDGDSSSSPKSPKSLNRSLHALSTAPAGASNRSCNRVEVDDLSKMKLMPNHHLRVGIIPAGSTDTIVISTTGTRDAVTAALHIIIGDNMPLDVVRVVGWKSSSNSKAEKPRIQYAVSFLGYGFYGDVAKESERYRWMGPSRYDYAGAKVFMKHKKYEAEVFCLEVPEYLRSLGQPFQGRKRSRCSNDTFCGVNCPVCAKCQELYGKSNTSCSSHDSRWHTSRGLFHSVGAAVISCRCDKSPNGLVPNAHLADGLLDLILIKECSRPAYLRQLISLTKKHSDPLSFQFIEHYKTPMFTFMSHGEESIWSLDGEKFPAHELSAQVLQGFLNIFARGPEI